MAFEVFYNHLSEDNFERVINENRWQLGLKIKECPSIRDAFSLISQAWFKNNLNEIFSLNFTINGNIEEREWQMMKSLRYEHKLMITFESSARNDYFLLFKPHGENLKCVNLSAHSDETKKFIVDHIHSSLANNRSGLLLNIRGLTDMEITSFGDENGFNLLMMASEQNRGDIVKELISLKCFDVNHKVGNVSAIDLTWNEGFYDIMLDLLNANSFFPVNFDMSLVPEDVRNFVNDSLRLHILIETHHATNYNNEIEILEISHIINRYKNLRHFLNPQNQSAAFTALNVKNYDTYGLLASKNIVVHPSEDISSIFNSTPTINKADIREIHKKHARCALKQYLLTIYGNCFFGIDNLENEEYWIKVIKAFETLNKIKDIQPILELVSHAGKFKIFFDFHRDSVQFLEPYQGDAGTNGLFYMNGLIYVAAKNLLNEETRNKTLGVLVHELCHFAMVLIYRNGARPYAVGDSNAQQEFENISNICQLSQNLENIIHCVYACYGPNLWHVELIVRIPHILAHFYNNSNKIKELLTSEQAPFRRLYIFYHEKVLPHIKDTIPVLTKITDEDLRKTLTLNAFTPQLKSKVKNSEVLFQGQKLSLLKIIEENSKAFDELSWDQLITLINSEEIEISQLIEDNDEVYVERKLFYTPKESSDSDASLEDINKKNEQTFDEIIILQSRVVILSDFAGAGKTTSLIKVAHELKKVFTSKWIQFIDLKSHFDAFEECKEQKFESIEELSTFLCSKLLKLDEKKLEKEIFVELFAAGKIVFLFDGVDEISPSFNEFARNLFVKIKELTKNIQWISTRPECANELENILNVKSFKFLNLTSEEVNEILRMFFVEQKLSEEEIKIRMKVANEIIEKLSNPNPKSRRSMIENRKIVNPLLIKMIADESLDHDFTKSINIFTLFENFFERKQKIIYERGEEVQKDCENASSKRMTISQVHQHFALKFLYKYEILNDKSVASLNILTRKIPWTADQINRYGILYLHVDGSFSFLHRSFAEFFVSQYIIENIYDCEDSPSEDEARMRVELLFIAINLNEDITRFFESYLDLKRELYEFDKTIQDSILSELHFNEFESNYDNSIRMYRFFVKFFHNSYETVKSLFLWADENILLVALRQSTKFYEEFLKLAKDSLIREDLKMLMDIKNDRGSFIYYMWKSGKRVNEDTNILKLNDEQINEILNSENFLEFFKRVKSDLDTIQLKKFFLKNSPEVMRYFTAWILDELKKFLSDDDFKQFLTKRDSDNISILFYLISSSSQIDENFLKPFYDLIEQKLSSEEISSSLMNSETISKIVVECNKNSFELSWKFIEHHNTEKQIKRLLSQRDFHVISLLFHSVMNLEDPKMFENLVKICDKYFTREEVRRIILEDLRRRNLFGGIIDNKTPDSTIKDIVEYLKIVFKGHERDLQILIIKEEFIWKSQIKSFSESKITKCYSAIYELRAFLKESLRK